jgi:septal ring-binding cell division protein DamX
MSFTIKTSKQWVLPPRPKPGRKSTPKRKDKDDTRLTSKHTDISSVSRNAITTHSPVGANSIDKGIISRISAIDQENLDLKVSLLSLINDYKNLKQLVLNGNYLDELSLPISTTSHKRSFHETETVDDLAEELKDLTHSSINPTPSSPQTNNPTSNSKSDEDFSKFINYERSIVDDFESDIDDFDMESPQLSRTTSPGSSDEDNSLMSTLTRSTTVSSVNTSSVAPTKSNKFIFDLPKYEEEDGEAYAFKFENLDDYNQVNDFLSEKLITNDITYYENFNQNDDFD